MMGALAIAAWAWVRANIIPTLIMAALVIVLGTFAWNAWTAATTAKQGARLERNQDAATIKASHDAIQTIDNSRAAELERGQIVKENQDAIDKAADPGAVTDAGIAGLSRLRDHRAKARTVQQADPR